MHTYVAVLDYATKVIEKAKSGKIKDKDEPAMSLSEWAEKSQSKVFK